MTVPVSMLYLIYQGEINPFIQNNMRRDFIDSSKNDQSDLRCLTWKLKKGLEANLLLCDINENDEPVWCGTDEQWGTYKDLIEK